MAVTVTPVARTVFGNKRAVISTITLDSSYLSGGEPLTAADLGLKQVDALLVSQPATGHIVQYVPSTALLHVFTSAAITVAGGAAAAGTDALSVKSNVLNKESVGAGTVKAAAALAEVASTTDLSAVSFTVFALGI